MKKGSLGSVVRAYREEYKGTNDQKVWATALILKKAKLNLELIMEIFI